MQIIPWDTSTSNFESIVILDSSSFVLRGLWNSRDNSWYASLFTIEDEPLFMGKKLLINSVLLNYVYNPKSPNGLIFVIPNDTDVVSITRDNMGVEVNLVYTNLDELL